ncbi:MAG: DUF484 family protein [Betaproteobacteria bacterium]|nr:DUF484 family protein [Betaproteobacteria bacterium]
MTPPELPQANANPITEDDIAHYLLNSPDFFARHAEVLAGVQFVSPHSQRTVSLQERQAEMLREKIKVLEARIMEMVRHGKDNVALADKMLRWARALFLVPSAAALPGRLVTELTDQFAVPQVALRLWGLASEFADLPQAQEVGEDVKLFASSLGEPFCGLNTGFDAAQWLAAPDAAVSLALVPLRSGEADSPAFGMLVLASPDSQRFRADMGTEFLVRFGEIASAALTRLR